MFDSEYMVSGRMRESRIPAHSEQLRRRFFEEDHRDSIIGDAT